MAAETTKAKFEGQVRAEQELKYQKGKTNLTQFCHPADRNEKQRRYTSMGEDLFIIMFRSD